MNCKLGQNKLTKMQHKKTKTQKNMRAFMRHEKQWLTCLFGVPEKEKREKEHLNVERLKLFQKWGKMPTHALKNAQEFQED